MIVDEQGSFKTQRQIPKMALIKPSIEDDNLVLNAQGKSPIHVPIYKELNKKINCRWNKRT